MPENPGWLERVGANIILIGGAAWAFVRFALGLERRYSERLRVEVAELAADKDRLEAERDTLRQALLSEREAHFLEHLARLELEAEVRILRPAPPPPSKE